MGKGVLSKGVTLGVKIENDTYKTLPNMYQTMDMGEEPEMLESTDLSDGTKTYEPGLSDMGELAPEFWYDPHDENSAYVTLSELEDADSVNEYKLTYPHGVTYTFKAKVRTMILGAATNELLKFKATFAIQEKPVRTLPSDTASITE